MHKFLKIFTLAEVEDQEKLCHMEEGLTGEDLKRMSLLGGLKDRNLAKKAIAEKYTLQQIMQVAINRETSKADADAMQVKSAININRQEKTVIEEVASDDTEGDRGTDQTSEGTDGEAQGGRQVAADRRIQRHMQGTGLERKV